MPLLIAAVEGIADPKFNLQAIQCTTHPAAVWIIVNGPAVERFGVNGTFNCLGQGTRANAALGLAPGKRVLHIGTGAGYYTAVMAHAVGREGRVLGIEVDDALAAMAVAAEAGVPMSAMVERLAHRGPDDQGVVERGRLVVGMRRLSVLDPTERGHQPMTSADVKYSFERAVNPATQSPGGGYFSMIAGYDDVAGGKATTLSGIETPPLVAMPPDHVLTKAFYLLGDMPGRWQGGKLWIESGTGRVNDGVTTIIIGSNDYAGAWAVDQRGRGLNPVSPGGETQREMSFRVGVNIVMHALTGNYKDDQVHIQDIMQRLRR